MQSGFDFTLGLEFLRGINRKHLLNDLSQLPPFSIPWKLLILQVEARSYCFTVSCVSESMFNYL